MRSPAARSISQHSVLSLFVCCLALSLQAISVNDSPMLLKARYQFGSKRLLWSFPMFYGDPGHNVDQLYARLDFHYNGNIFISEDIYHNGISCINDFDCEFDNKLVYIFDTTGKRQLAAHPATVGLYLEPSDASSAKRLSANFNFYFNNSDPLFIRYHVIGLHTYSDFWKYLIGNYCNAKSRVSLLFETKLKATNYLEILEDLSLVSSTLTVNPVLEMSQFFASPVKNSFSISNAQVSFGDFWFNSMANFSYESPYIMKLCAPHYKKLVETIKGIICIKPESCESDSDIHMNILTHEKLDITFENNKDPMMPQTFTVKFSIKELYFIAPNGDLMFNFDSYVAEPGSKNLVIFGLLFLQKCKLIFTYSAKHNEYEIVLMHQESIREVMATRMFVLLSILLSVVVTVMLVGTPSASDKDSMVADENSLGSIN
jgi:hypothetical protein